MMPRFKEARTLLSINNVLYQIGYIFFAERLQISITGWRLVMDQYFCISDIQSDWDPGCLLPCHWADMSLLKGSVNTLLCDQMHYPSEKVSYSIDQKLFFAMIKKGVQYFSLPLHCRFWGNDCHLPRSFTWPPIPYHKLGEMWFVFFRCHKTRVPAVSPRANADWWLISQ